ncbi:MAG: type II toxin-antitoxin system RelE/ParE family toxin [Alphaproteobacteria bacterium]|nr:type II toxin-antitoxin system RelE/ParE family toxin [Alphaproteobacteria bacterium]
MARLVLERTAIRDLGEIAEFIAQDNPVRAFTFIEEIKDACRTWAENPLSGRARPEIAQGLRSFPHGNYVIFYRPLPDGIAVLRVLHGKRDTERGI